MNTNVVNITNESKRLELLKKKIAVQIHVYYTDLLFDIYVNLSEIPFNFDLYLSTDTGEKYNEIQQFFKSNKIKGSVFIEVFENRGRDIAPFIMQMKDRIKTYDYICHLHTKKSKHSLFGDEWRDYLYFNLMGTKNNIESLFYLFENNKEIGIIYPETYLAIKDQMVIGSNQEIFDILCDRMNIPNKFNNRFPAGSMFWARTQAIMPLFETVIIEDFDNESGQLDCTMAHAIERILVVLTEGRGYQAIQTFNKTVDNYFTLTAENDINSYKAQTYAYKNKIIELQNQLQTETDNKDFYYNQSVFYKNELNRVLNSSSWKVTTPLRKFSGAMRKIVKGKSPLSCDVSSNEEVGSYYKNYPAYSSDYQENINFEEFHTDIKTVAFYLPQFHTFKENDAWWGKGFTEWTNTKKAKPHFKGHYQPREPHDDIGYYKLDNIDTIKKQVTLAKEHGIYGFCFYYYWFSGKRLMEKPVDLFIKNKDVDFPFCLCWANENWTRTWDGLEKNVLIKQEYSDSDYKNFILDIEKYITDPRYIKIDGKPVVIIYNPKAIPNFKKHVYYWRKYARECGIGELYIITKTDLVNTQHEFTEYVDAEYDFPPHGMGHPATKITGLDTELAYSYRKLVDDIGHLYRDHFPLKPFYYTCTMGWDNSARRKENYTVYYDYNLESYYKWLNIIITETRRRNKEENRFMFINAWNEWAEGTYLEPDKKYGYANINTLSKAIFDLPVDYNKKDKK